MQRVFSARRLKIKLIVFVGFLVRLIIIVTVISVLLSNSSLYQSASVFSCQNVIVFLTVLLDLFSSIVKS